jgi:hypothetical protein
MMKIVTITREIEIDGKDYFPGIGVVTDAVATALSTASAISGSAIDYRAPNPFGNMVFRGAYGGTTAYVAGDVVTQGGAVFVAIADSVGESTADTDFFEPLALEGGAELAALLAAIPATNIPVLGTTTNIPTSNVTLSTSNTYTDAAVKTAIDSAANGIRTAAEARLDAAEAKIDAMLGLLSTAGIMAAP